MRRTTPFAFLLLLAGTLPVTVSGCRQQLPAVRDAKVKTYTVRVDVSFHGFRRTYRAHLPPALAARRPLPLVVIVHGAFGSGRRMERLTGFSDLADREGFVAVYVDGLGVFGALRHWNAGHCCGKAAADEWDDVGYVASVIDDVAAQVAIDRERVYLVGYSNGGMLTHRFAAERGALLAAAATIAATGGGRPDRQSDEWHLPDPVAPLPLLAIHGAADEDVPFAGGPSGRGEREFWPVQKTLDVWIGANACEPKPAVPGRRSGGLTVTEWSGCRDDADVVLMKLDGWGHEWPAATETLSSATPGFDAAEAVWAFFEPRRR